MKFRSTRKKAPTVSFSEALQAGLATDGGLYVPESFPTFSFSGFSASEDLAKIAQTVLSPFLKNDVLEKNLKEIVARAFDFPAPLMILDQSTAVLELFHGPTAAFKDFGARFLAESLKHLANKKTRTILVATSGDTGGAVAAAFHGHPGVEVFILYPKGMVSPFQEKQLTCWGQNIRAFRVRGDFDACQRLVKEAFEDSWWKQNKNLTSANSINMGRILPQVLYYVAASIQYFKKTGRRPGIIVPSGNLGNATAALWAKKMGFPIEKVILACNANRAVTEYFKTGVWQPGPTIATLANAMDVGNPSNMERVLDLYPKTNDLRHDAAAYSVSDKEIQQAIKRGKSKWNRIWCPHTAAAASAREQVSTTEKSGDWIIVATAHPAKFAGIVEPHIGEKIPMPPALSAIATKETYFEEIDADLGALKGV